MQLLSWEVELRIVASNCHNKETVRARHFNIRPGKPVLCFFDRYVNSSCIHCPSSEMALAPSSPRLPSPPPAAEIQMTPNSPSGGPAATLETTQMEQSLLDANSKRRIHPGTKAADMAAGPPLVPLSEVNACSPISTRPSRRGFARVANGKYDTVGIGVFTTGAPCCSTLQSHSAGHSSTDAGDSPPNCATASRHRSNIVALRALPIPHLAMQHPHCRIFV